MFADDPTIGQEAQQPARTHDVAASTKLFGSILVVDDCSYGRKTISTVLRSVGLRVETAENGQMACQRALAALEAGRPFDLILTDMDMPVMDGYEAMTYLRERGYPGRIVALTATSDEDAREQCFIAGCDDFATKPIIFAKLVDLAKRNLHSASAPISLAEARKVISASRIRPASTLLCA